MQRIHEPEAVATGDEHGIGGTDRSGRVIGGVHAGDLDTKWVEPFRESGCGSIVVPLRVRDHHSAQPTAKVFDDGRSRRGAVTTGMKQQTSMHAWA